MCPVNNYSNAVQKLKEMTVESFFIEKNWVREKHLNKQTLQSLLGLRNAY